ncbi:efflux RND transporter permease subunit, partial [Bacteroides cellulosilyticus]
MRNYRLTFLVVGLMFILGIYGLDKMPKAEFPDFTLRTGVVVGVYPGATSEEVEEQLVRPLERYLFTFKEVKRAKTTSTSQNGICSVMVELNDDVDNKDEVWSKIKHGLNSFKSTLPQGVADVVVNDEFGDTSALLVAVESDSWDYRQLEKYCDLIGDRLRTLPSVSNVRILGNVKERISVIVDYNRLSAYGIGSQQLADALSAQGITTVSGSVSGWQKDMPVHVSPALRGEDEIAELIIYSDADNRVVRVKDVARVERGYDLTDGFIEYNGHRCVIISLEMLAGNNIVQYGRDVETMLAEIKAAELPEDVSIH